MSFLGGRCLVSLDLPSDRLPSDENGSVSDVMEDSVWWTRIGLVSLPSAGGLSARIMLTLRGDLFLRELFLREFMAAFNLDGFGYLSSPYTS